MVARGAKGGRPMSRSLRAYQKAAIVFTVVALLLLLAVLYLSLSSATITVVPNPKVVSTTTSVEISPDPTAVGQVSGYVIQDTFTKAKTFSIPAEGGTAVEEKAGGTVTLINETDAPQSLVATTRVLSEEGVLFRLVDAVTIPANGTLDTAVLADQPGLSGEIGPTQFTIPGLSAALQEVIYAVSVENMTGGVKYIAVLNESHLTDATLSLEQEILDESKAMLRERFESDAFDGEAYLTEIATKVSDTEPGTEADSFNVELGVVITGIFYNTELLSDYAQAELYSQVPNGFELIETNKEGMTVEVQSVTPAEEAATLSLYLDGVASVTTASDILDLDRLSGMSGDDVVELLTESEAIEEARVEFTPFFLNRVPTLQDHVRIIIE